MHDTHRNTQSQHLSIRRESHESRTAACGRAGDAPSWLPRGRFPEDKLVRGAAYEPAAIRAKGHSRDALFRKQKAYLAAGIRLKHLDAEAVPGSADHPLAI